MTITKVKTGSGEVIGYELSLSREETFQWAHRPGKVWPNSALSGNSFSVTVNSNGITDLRVDDLDFSDREGIMSNEVEAIVNDYLPDDCKRLWPSWQKIT